MVKKKISGQAIAIIILVILLLLAIGFGGVFAFYSVRTNQIIGKIMMANLNINLYTTSSGGASGGSERSEIVISNGTNVVPGQELKNSPLMVTNTSNTKIFLMIVYKLEAETLNGTIVEDDFTYPVIDVGYDYINPNKAECSTQERDKSNSKWVDFVFGDGIIQPQYRCLFYTEVLDEQESGQSETVTVIPSNKLVLHHVGIDDKYQNTQISFTFQAYAIAANTFTTPGTDGYLDPQTTDNATLIQAVMSAVFTSVGSVFLNINT